MRAWWRRWTYTRARYEQLYAALRTALDEARRREAEARAAAEDLGKVAARHGLIVNEVRTLVRRFGDSKSPTAVELVAELRRALDREDGVESVTDELLHENEWVSLRQVKAPEKGIYGYVYSHETRCQGRIVAVLPFRLGPAGVEVMVKCEVTPCWNLDEPTPSALTGGWEGGDLAEDAVRELWEEAGYQATADELIRLGTCLGTKSTDTTYHLYAVDVTRKTQQAAPGDGSRLESEAETRWLAGDAVADVRATRSSR